MHVQTCFSLLIFKNRLHQQMFLDLHIFSISINSIYFLMIPKSELPNFQKQNEGYARFSNHATSLCVQARKFWSQ